MEHRKTVYTFQNRDKNLTKQILTKYCQNYHFVSQYSTMLDGQQCIIYVYNFFKLDPTQFIEVTENQYYVRIFAYYGTQEKPCPIDTSKMWGMAQALEIKNRIAPLIEELNIMQNMQAITPYTEQYATNLYQQPVTQNTTQKTMSTVYTKSDSKKAFILALMCLLGGLFSILGACINFSVYMICSAVTGFGSVSLAYSKKYRVMIYIGFVFEFIGFFIFMFKK